MSDDGAPDPRLAAALRSWTPAGRPAERAEVLAALTGARVFLALAARPARTRRPAGGAPERSTEMALLSLVGADGVRALPVFSDGRAVQHWRPEARPVPVAGPRACAAAADAGATALLLDPPAAAFLVRPAEVAAVAAGRVPVPGTVVSTRITAAPLAPPTARPDDDLLAALGSSLAGEPVVAARLLVGPDGPVLGVVPSGPSSAGELAALADRVARRLGSRLPPDGLDLAAVPPSGPGTPVPLGVRGRWRRRR